MDPQVVKTVNSLVESCKPAKKRGRPSSNTRQLHEIRLERKVNLQTAKSVLTSTNLKSILTLDNLKSLPPNCQTLLVKLLPERDQIRDPKDGIVRPSPTALSNEYFTRFCAQYTEKLAANKFTDEAIEQAKTVKTKEFAKLDPWKLKNFEPIWGQKLISQDYDDSDEGG